MTGKQKQTLYDKSNTEGRVPHKRGASAQYSARDLTLQSFAMFVHCSAPHPCSRPPPPLSLCSQKALPCAVRLRPSESRLGYIKLYYYTPKRGPDKRTSMTRRNVGDSYLALLRGRHLVQVALRWAYYSFSCLFTRHSSSAQFHPTLHPATTTTPPTSHPLLSAPIKKVSPLSRIHWDRCVHATLTEWIGNLSQIHWDRCVHATLTEWIGNTDTDRVNNCNVFLVTMS